MKFTIINGPNLNLLGNRDPGMYGRESFDVVFNRLQENFRQHQLSYFQSNVEGEIINRIQEVGRNQDGILINPGGLTHTSVAIRDAIDAIEPPVIEVHISHIEQRESFRQVNLISDVCAGSIVGLGTDGYRLGLEHLIDLLND